MRVTLSVLPMVLLFAASLGSGDAGIRRLVQRGVSGQAQAEALRKQFTAKQLAEGSAAAAYG